MVELTAIILFWGGQYLTKGPLKSIICAFPRYSCVIKVDKLIFLYVFLDFLLKPVDANVCGAKVRV